MLDITSVALVACRPAASRPVLSTFTVPGFLFDFENRRAETRQTHPSAVAVNFYHWIGGDWAQRSRDKLNSEGSGLRFWFWLPVSALVLGKHVGYAAVRGKCAGLLCRGSLGTESEPLGSIFGTLQSLLSFPVCHNPQIMRSLLTADVKHGCTLPWPCQNQLPWNINRYKGGFRKVSKAFSGNA